MTHAGTGKKVIDVCTYRNFRKKHPGEACLPLFVVRREEILTKSKDTFRGVLRDLNFGELSARSCVTEERFFKCNICHFECEKEKVPCFCI